LSSGLSAFLPMAGYMHKPPHLEDVISRVPCCYRLKESKAEVMKTAQSA